MKKLLLFACTALFAISASAQATVNMESASVEKLQYKLAENMKAMSAANVEALNNANVAAAPATDKVTGNYIEDNIYDIHECSAATITAMDGNKFKIAFATGYAEIEGTYDPATGVITCGTQECGSYTNTSTGVTFYFTIKGISSLDLANGKLNVTDDLSFTVADDGSISLNQEGYILIISDCTNTDYTGMTWVWYTGTRFMPVNAVQEGRASTSGSWEAYSTPVAVEDYEYSVNVYNFCGSGCLSIDINDNGTVSVATGQHISALNLSDDSEYDTYGYYINFVGVKLDGGYISRDYDKTTVTGTIKDNVITLGEYFALASLSDPDGAAYARGWYAPNATITLNEGNYLATSGIEEIGMTREDRIKNTKTYNIMGQQVDRSTAKGLLIRDGKKYIKK